MGTHAPGSQKGSPQKSPMKKGLPQKEARKKSAPRKVPKQAETPKAEPPVNAFDAKAHLETLVCTACGDGGNEHLMLLCEVKGCNRGYHTYCSGHGKQIPEGVWFCPTCDPLYCAASGSKNSWRCRAPSPLVPLSARSTTTCMR